jgi:creatinine amidohydrolase/Fe(II)-dependent formamide hydrolase-like protein
VRNTILNQVVTWPWTTDEKDIADSGVIGDAKSASAEFGEQLLAKIAEEAGDILKQLLQRQQLSHG